MSTVLSPPASLWCADGLTVSIDGPGLQHSISLDRPYALVGSSPRCDVVVPILEASPVALYLHATADAIYWLDLSSPTGHWRSGAFGTNGCLIWRGYHLALDRIRGDGVPAAPHGSTAVVDSLDDRLADVPAFDVGYDGRRMARAKLTHALTLVGKSPRCRLRLRNRHVSEDHCLFHVVGRQAWVVDLLSREGTYVNGQRVAASDVTLDDVVTLGKPTLTMIRWTANKPAAISSPAVDLASDDNEEVEDADLVATDIQFTDVDGINNDDAASAPSGAAVDEPPAGEPSDDVADLGDASAKKPNAESCREVDGSLAASPAVVEQPPHPASDDGGSAGETAPCPPATACPSATSPAAAARRDTLDTSAVDTSALDRLILRHRLHRRRRTVRWSLVVAALLAGVAGVVGWASQNIDAGGDHDAYPYAEWDARQQASFEHGDLARPFGDDVR